MSGGGGAYGGGRGNSHDAMIAYYVARKRRYDAMYGVGWEEATVKTLERELKDRGIEPRSGDEGYQLVPTPRLTGDRISLAMILFSVVIVGFMLCWAWWEWLPPDAVTK